MKRRKMVVGASIACLFIVIAIQAVLGGGMGLSINPKDVETTPGSTITYGITVYNYYSTTESFYISVDPESCDYDWFGWHTTSISIPGRGQGQVSLDVTPTQAGNYNFTVRAFLARDPGTQAIQTAHISVVPPPPPAIVSYAPQSPVIDYEGVARAFNITINQTVDVSWLLNGTEVSTNTSVIEASYTNVSAAIGTWNVSAIVSNPNGADMQEWVWTVKPGLNIVSYAPPSPVSDIENATRTFNITIDQIANVCWLLNGTEVSTNTSVIEASYTNASAAIGTWNVSAIASNPSGTDMQEWVWTVTAVPPPNIVSYAPPSPVSDVENATRTFNITIDQIANVSWLLNGTEVSTNTSVIEASYTNASATIGTWNVSAIASNPNGTDMQTWIWNVMAPSTQFIIYGWVFYENGSACNNPIVNITNLNTSTMWPHVEESDNYYKLNLTPGIDINESEVLLFDVKSPDALPSNITIHWVTKDDINVSGLFPFNITLNYPPTCIALMPNISYQPQINGTNITWKACAFDPEGDELWFRFWLDGPRTGGIGNPAIVQNWSKSNVWIWETNGSDVGDNLIYADVRDCHHANNFTVPEYDLYERMWYWIT